MGVLRITGNLEGATVRLERIKRIIDHRKMVGYPIFHSSERWLYVTHPERGVSGEVCPVCLTHAEKGSFTGDEVKATFPYVVYAGDYIAYPKSHQPDLSLFMGVECNCELELQNPVEAFETQLHREKLEAI